MRRRRLSRGIRLLASSAAGMKKAHQLMCASWYNHISDIIFAEHIYRVPVKQPAAGRRLNSVCRENRRLSKAARARRVLPFLWLALRR